MNSVCYRTRAVFFSHFIVVRFPLYLIVSLIVFAFVLFMLAVWAETGDFRDNSHSSMTSVANSLDISQLHFQPPTNLRNNKTRDRKPDGKFAECSQ